MSMLKLESFFFFSFFLFLAGCGNQSKPVSVEQEIITPLSAGNAVNDLLPYIDSVEVVPLETTGKALIGLVGKILLLPNGNVLIKSTASMFMFSPKGKFLFQIGKNGRGPEEYLTIDDVCLSQDARELWILGGCEIVKYSTERVDPVIRLFCIIARKWTRIIFRKISIVCIVMTNRGESCKNFCLVKTMA